MQTVQRIDPAETERQTGHRGSAPVPAQPSIWKMRAAGDPDLRYHLYVPSSPQAALPLFVAVHGISRDVTSQARLFAPFMEEIGGVVVAPLFQKRRFSDYQRLGRMGRSDRADMALDRIVADVSQRVGRQFPRIVMFGYSGGGQFVHRYAMAHPRRIDRIAVAAPGWYTFPDMGEPFPRGIGRSASLPDIIFDPARFLEIPTWIAVGEEDMWRDANLNKNPKIDRRQGANRMERAKRWRAEMAAAAARYTLDTAFHLETLPDCGHSFVDCMKIGGMGRQVVDFLFQHHSNRRRPSERSADASARIPSRGISTIGRWK